VSVSPVLYTFLLPGGGGVHIETSAYLYVHFILVRPHSTGCRGGHNTSHQYPQHHADCCHSRGT